ncbi:MAG: hypothetical protein V4635_11640 [Bacteroidota bacterium]
MILRFNTLFNVLLPELKLIKKTLLFLMLAGLCPAYSQTPSSIDDIKKEASKLFEEEEFTRAYKFYSQLVANFPKDPEYNYKLGVCMIYSEPDKKKCLPYLQFASRNANSETKDVSFYLGRAYHINYLFDEAIKNYNAYKQTGSSARQKKLGVDREIKACNNGKRLLSNLTDLVVQSKKELNEADYFRSYDLKDMNGKLLVKPEEFNSGTDKKKKDKSIVFLPKAGNRVYYSSYGENTDNGKDIYYSVKLENGGYSPPKKVSGINTEFDEDYPFLHPNGQTLYFASKGHNSMGGYDIFKSNYIEASDSWTQPVNLEFPINSPDDDYLFVTDSLEKTAYFTTGRQSPPGKTDVLKINTERKPIDLVVIKGAVTKESPDQSLKSKISIKNLSGGGADGIYYAEDNGDYLMSVSNGAKIMMTVETPGFKTQSQEVLLPLAETSKPFKQTISYTEGILKITNDFDTPVTDDNYLQYLKVIEKKAKLDVNEGDNNLAANTAVKDTVAKKSTSPQLIDQTTDSAAVAAKPAQSVDNKQLANMAKQDAVESRNEAIQLKQDSNDAMDLGQKQKDEAATKLASANEALKSAEAIENGDEKKVAIEKATLIKQEAENEDAVANKILEFAKSLDADATVKQKEATLNEQYAIELEKTINTKNNDKASLLKLEELQKQITDLSAQKNESENLFNSIKISADEKEKQIAALEKTNADVKVNLSEIKTEISNSETELANTKKKKDKEVINTQISELKAQQTEKESQLATNDIEIKKLNDELTGIKSELNIANRIRTEAIVPIVTNTVPLTPPAASTTIVNKPTLAANTKSGDKITKTAPQKNAGPKPTEKPDYTPLTATTKTEAITKLDKLNTQLSANDNELFDFNSYQNPDAQRLRVEADARINDAIAQQKKLKDEIAASKNEIGTTSAANNNTVSSESLAKEGDEFALQAQKLRTEAGKLAAPQKEINMAKARELDAKSNEKYLESAGVVGSDNKSVYETNQENIKQLIAENKSPTNEISEANNLNAEAIADFKQAAEIRQEATALSSAGAKLGSLSNAEEIEAEALLRQKQAIELLKKSNPDLALKAAVTSTSTATQSEGPTDLNSKLQNVNTGMSDLVNIKIASYQKLYDANNLETEATLASITRNQALLDKSPGMKSDYISGSAKIESARSLKQKSDSTLNPADKLSDLTAAIKKQLEALKQLNSLNASLNQAALKAEGGIAKQGAQKNNTIETKTNGSLVKANETAPGTSNKLIEISELAKGDSTAGQLVSYLSNKPSALNNPQADASVKKSLQAIMSSEAEIKAIENKLTNNQPAVNEPVVPPGEQRSKASALLAEYEQLNTKALESRKEAEALTGEEKEKLILAATEMETKSQEKKLEASKLTQSANVSEYETNNNAIAEMLNSLKNDNAELFAELNSKNKELVTANEKTKKLREESEAQPNAAARLGANGNAEEKEAEVIQSQTQLIAELKKQYPNYEVKPFVPGANDTPESLNEKKNQLREKQYADLTNLTNAFSLEYESSKNAVPAKLNANQSTLKKNAEDLNAESKRLLIEASQEKDETKKIKLLTLSAKSGNAAVEQLNKLLPKKTELAKTTPKNNATGENIVATNTKNTGGAKTTKKKNNSNTDPYALFANNNGVSDTAAVTTPGTDNTVTKPVKTKTQPPKNVVVKETKKAVSKSSVKIDGLEVTPGNAYNEARPIPLDSKIEDGLVFRVQIGAFKTKLANDAFKGLSPLNGETTPSGYIRYTAGNFNKIENANAVKNDLRSLGYSDAFVVVYYNGKRISLNEALAILEKEGKAIDTNAPQTAGITANSNIPKIQAPATTAVTNPQDNAVVVTRELEEINGLLYTVQIGVYTKQITSRQLLNLKPIFTEKLTNGLFRYTAGIYNNAERLITDKRRVVDLGVRDAFVSAYLNGKRIPFNDGRTKQAEDSTVKMEAENPIVFSDVSAPVEIPAETPVVSQPNPAVVGTTTVQPFKNNVSKYPDATAENGIKENEEGLTFKVQIGAYSKQVPNDVASKYLSITTWPIENKQINSLFIYNIGNFSGAKFAKVLKEEAIKLGITDAFISVYNNGTKLYGAEAAAALSK